ncbi:putative 40S ribosomal protein S10 [Paratrimastix pyriformis]|uniref:40S ribosomal protein S10 n=1 Tax=Paratrimastix pyriformis TaxID=342808 RepID=A0ABQ8UG20_9EUKA|nr:putative 40S ribosomal protein S10 [Paratrimastix pyriformis]
MEFEVPRQDRPFKSWFERMIDRYCVLLPLEDVKGYNIQIGYTRQLISPNPAGKKNVDPQEEPHRDPPLPLPGFVLYVPGFPGDDLQGVLFAKKDFWATSHPIAELKDIPNLQVIKTMQSLRSRKFVKETFNWSHFYWYLTFDGLNYLREYLHLAENVVPNTLKKQQSARPPSSRPPRFEGRGGYSDRDAYRRTDDKKAGGEFAPKFRGERRFPPRDAAPRS